MIEHAFAQSRRAIIGNEYGFDVSATERYQRKVKYTNFVERSKI